LDSRQKKWRARRGENWVTEEGPEAQLLLRLLVCVCTVDTHSPPPPPPPPPVSYLFTFASCKVYARSAGTPTCNGETKKKHPRQPIFPPQLLHGECILLHAFLLPERHAVWPVVAITRKCE